MSFSDVDSSQRPEALVGHLDRAAVTSAEVRAELRRLVVAGPPGPIVDLGAGAGHDVIELARSGRRVIGVEPSTVMAAEAMAKADRAGVAPSLVRARGEALPFPDASVAGCHIDRVLQHVDDPVSVLSEVHRVLVPGGRIVILEPDWGTFSIDLEDEEAVEAITRCRTRSFAQGRIGLRLRGLLIRSGFADVACRQLPRGATSPADSAVRFDLAVDRTVEAGLLSQARADRVLQQMDEAVADGTFWASYNRYLATALRP